MNNEFNKGKYRFTEELLRNGDLCNPFPKGSEEWKGFEKSKDSWEQIENQNEAMSV